MERNNIFSILNIQGGEASQQSALMLARTFSEKLKKRTVYIPAGITFDDTGSLSLTELYHDFLKSKDFRFDKNESLLIVKPFNCFAEFLEIRGDTYIEFVNKISSLFDISIINIDNLSSEMILYFIESSVTTAIIIDCNQSNYASRFENFMRNLKILWGKSLPEHMDKFIFIINKGSETEKLLINNIALRESGCEDYDFNSKIYFPENNFLSSKTLFNNKPEKTVFSVFRNISKKAEGLFNAK